MLVLVPHRASAQRPASACVALDVAGVDRTDAVAQAVREHSCVQLPAGRVRVRSLRFLHGDVEIRGAGQDRTIVEASVDGSGAWLAAYDGSLILRDLTIRVVDGPPAHPPFPFPLGDATVRWFPGRAGARGRLSGVRFQNCPQVCVYVGELLDSLIVAQMRVGTLPNATPQRQTFAISVRNDATRTGTPPAGTVSITDSDFDNSRTVDRAGVQCDATARAGGVFLYAAVPAAPLHADIVRNRFRCLGAPNEGHPVGSVDLYANVSHSRIAHNVFEAATYSAIKIASSSDLRIVANRIVASDSEVAAPAIVVVGCIRNVLYCPSAFGRWTIDSNSISGRLKTGFAIYAGGGYAMARSAAPEMVRADCGVGGRVDHRLVCVNDAGEPARPYLASGVRITGNRIERAPGPRPGGVAIKLEEVSAPQIAANVILGAWTDTIVVPRRPRSP